MGGEEKKRKQGKATVTNGGPCGARGNGGGIPGGGGVEGGPGRWGMDEGKPGGGVPGGGGPGGGPGIPTAGGKNGGPGFDFFEQMKFCDSSE